MDKGEPSADLYGSCMASSVRSRRSKNSRVVLGLHGGGSTKNCPPSPPQAATSDEPLHGESWFAPLDKDHLTDKEHQRFSKSCNDVGGVIAGATSPNLSLMDSDLHNVRHQ